MRVNLSFSFLPIDSACGTSRLVGSRNTRALSLSSSSLSLSPLSRQVTNMTMSRSFVLAVVVAVVLGMLVPSIHAYGTVFADTVLPATSQSTTFPSLTSGTALAILHHHSRSSSLSSGNGGL